MEWYTVAIGIPLVLMFFIGIGLPIPFALVVASVPFLWTIQDFSTSLISIELMLWGSWINYILVAVPLFILLGEIVGRSKIGPRLFQVMHEDISVRGSAAYGTIATCAGFGAVCGSSMIGALTIGKVALPEMLRHGYGKQIAAGVIASGGTLSVLIPPSLILLFYAVVTDVSISRLFIAGVVPGLLLALLFAIVVLVWRIVRSDHVPAVARALRWSLARTLYGLFPIIVIGCVIVGSLYFGIATPTEAAALAVVATVTLAVWIGGLSFQGFVESLFSTLRTMGYLGLLFSGAVLLGFVLTYHEIPQQIARLVAESGLGPHGLLALVILFYLLVGMFLEPASITFITLPTIYPLVESAGYNMVWFGIIYTITMEIAAITPPVGLNLYVIEGLSTKEYPVRVTDVIVGCLPFITALVALVALLIGFPELALWLPVLMD